MLSNVDYHLHRARAERDIAYRSADACVSDLHMRLSALHLQRAMLLQDVQRSPVGNVSPFRPTPDDASPPARPRPATDWFNCRHRWRRPADETRRIAPLTAMDGSEFEDGYLAGWASVAGNELPPPSPACPPDDRREGKSPFALGYACGRNAALQRGKAVAGGDADRAELA